MRNDEGAINMEGVVTLPSVAESMVLALQVETVSRQCMDLCILTIILVAGTETRV